MAIARFTLATTSIALLLAALPAGPALAQHAGHGAAAGASSATSEAPLTDGEVRRIDPAKGTILLKHGEMKHLGMSAMTMGFKLRDPALANGLKPGDRIRFAAVQEGETLVVTRIVKP